MSRERSSASGCHWTPRAKRLPGSSIASDELVEVRPAGDLQPVADAVDALVMMGLRRVTLLTGRARGQRAREQAHVVVDAVEAARHAPVMLVAEQLGQVLVQGAPARDVDDLHPAADAEQRQVALERAAHEGDLERVAPRIGVDGQRVAPRAVGARVDVDAAGEHEPVDHVERLVGRPR